eukprot:CAMPEP_0197192566 /NCGR_PEP_ID=MMETSP1423-20130617/25242_1 /TAXON_ID=476441 /ORGANISM="Pseudo-nitzschia heimii, Strain UNC1101" /LENGTH=398 /DNA_ID=CAMNT_0042645473 /DNA_START=252 /DNA_END=1448 /DNA_ORIENTATION=-
MATNASEVKGLGDHLYRQALRLMSEADDLENKKEEKRSNMMFEAYQRSKEKELNPKSQGVTVVKTLVKEVRKERTMNNNGSVDKRNEAMELLKQAANEYDHPDAAVQLGNILLKAASRSMYNKAEQDDWSSSKEAVNTAIELFRRAGAAGSRVGWYNLGHLLWTGFPVPGKLEYQKREENSSTMVAQEIGDTRFIVADTEQAMNAFREAIKLGDNDAMYLVGVHQLGQDDLECNRSGLILIERAADNGHDGAQYYLALLHLNGEPDIGIEPCSSEKFVTLLDGAVESGSVDARFVRGNCFCGGTEGYPHDFKRALDDFLQAADAGHADSAVSAGAMFHNGVGVLKDQRKAFELYQLGGELGSKEGWMNVVDCWQQGLGVPKSEETARYIKETMLKTQK